MVFALDNLPAHLPSHSSTTLLPHTTLPFSNNSVPTLVDSSTMDNFINKSLVALTPHLLQCLSAPIPLKLFDGDPTPARDITHCLEMIMTFAKGWQQELQLLIMKLHPSVPVILGFSWLHSTNPHINWPSLTLCLNQNNPTNSGLVPFNVLPTLVNSGASGTFISSQLDLQCYDFDKPLKLQLFHGSPTTIGITQYHDNTLTLDNNLQFQAWLLITQLLLSTPIMLELLWLQDVNPDINWRNLTMQFPSPEASLAATIPLCLQSILDSNVSDSNASTFRVTLAAIPLCLQSILDSNVSNSNASTSGVTQSPLTSNNDPNSKENATPPQSLLTKS
ncbi:hypothetical protein J132_02078 [Termitomyces sp. J132]|nr:hypothetical protein J132_02078 [Termitomyces sp. J132]